MDDKKMRFLKEVLFLIANMCLYIVYKHVGEFGNYKHFRTKVSELEKQYKKEWE